MILENIKKPKYIYRILLMFLLLIFTLTSSLVYAHEIKEPAITEAFNSKQHFVISSAPTTNNITITRNDAVENTDSILQSASIQRVPPVQALYMTAATSNTLYQGHEYDSFFEHSVFVGDSLSVGFQNFCIQHSDSIATDTTYFLAKQSCSAKAAISKNALTTYSGIMPEYQGKVQRIEDSISQMPDIQKVFICYGMNDLVCSTPEQFVNDFETLISRIINKNQNVSIYILSIPCIARDVQTENLSNESIQTANSLLASTCKIKKWGFINTAEYLMNEDLSIRDEYSSDGYVHENNAAYREWTKVLRNYAYVASTHNN